MKIQDTRERLRLSTARILSSHTAICDAQGLIDLGLVRSGTSASATFTATPTCDAIC